MFTACEQILNLNWFIKSNYKQTSQIYLLAIKHMQVSHISDWNLSCRRASLFTSQSVRHGEGSIYSCFAAPFNTLKFFFHDTTEVIQLLQLSLSEVTPIYVRGMSCQGVNLIMLSQSNKLNMTKQSCFYFYKMQINQLAKYFSSGSPVEKSSYTASHMLVCILTSPFNRLTLTQFNSKTPFLTSRQVCRMIMYHTIDSVTAGY